MRVLLIEMANIGHFYAAEGETKFDHVHLKQKGQDKAEFWLTDKDRFIEKTAKDKRNSLEENANKIAKKLKEQGFVEAVKIAAMQTYGRVYPYKED